jgi:hypothetical protein
MRLAARAVHQNEGPLHHFDGVDAPRRVGARVCIAQSSAGGLSDSSGFGAKFRDMQTVSRMALSSSA